MIYSMRNPPNHSHLDFPSRSILISSSRKGHSRHDIAISGNVCDFFLGRTRLSESNATANRIDLTRSSNHEELNASFAGQFFLSLLSAKPREAPADALCHVYSTTRATACQKFSDRYKRSLHNHDN